MILLFNSHLDDPVEWTRELKRHIPELEVRIWPDVGDPGEVDAALVWLPPEDGFGRYPNLKAVLALGAGVNQLDLTTLPPGVPLARLVDHGLTEGMTDYCLFAVLRYKHRIDEIERNQRLSRWEYLPAIDKAQLRVGILGLGELGGDLARTLVARGFPVRGWSRTPKTIEGVATFAGEGELAAFAAETDVAVCLLPLTPATRGILGTPFFDLLPRGARIVNAGRGAHLVEADLLAALDSGQLAGATLDVFAQEPLPADHPFWRHPKILLTPHVATYGTPASASSQVAENLRRALAGQELVNQVDIARGY